MPQNVVVGQDAVDVARFVATYAGRQAPAQVGIINCQQRPLGTLPPGSGQVAAGSSSGSGGTSTTAASVSTGTPSTEIAAVPAPRRRRSAKAKRTTRS